MNKNEAKNIITEFKINRPAEKHVEYLEEHTTCCLCGTDLDFAHVTNFITHKVEEQAHCSSCSIDHKKEDHTLQ